MIARLIRCRPLRGLAAGGIRIVSAITQGSRTRPGLHAVARYAGLCRALNLSDAQATMDARATRSRDRSSIAEHDIRQAPCF